MDKYEFNIKVEQIRKLVNREDFETAKKITDAIDWKRVHNANLLSMVSQVYEKNNDYRTAREILLMAFERAPIGKRLLYKLTELALKEGNAKDAEAYYRKFCELAGDDPRQHLLRYMILKQRNAPTEQMIHSLESYMAEELDEKWLYELAELYHKSGDAERCVNTCDKLMLMFGLGKYVDKAMELKVKYASLSKYQMDLVENREKYEAKLHTMEDPFEEEEALDEDYGQEQEAQVAEEEEPEGGDYLRQTKATQEGPFENEMLEAEVKQAEAQEHLAKELSRMSMDIPVEEENELGKTRILGDIRRSRPTVTGNKSQPIPPAPLPEENEALEPPVPAEPEPTMPDLERMFSSAMESKETVPPTISEPAPAYHLMVEARTPEKGMEVAVQLLKRIRRETGVKNPVAKITGSKLNRRGVRANARKLAGKDLMVEEAGDMAAGVVKELVQLISQDKTGMRVILIDNPKQMGMLMEMHPSLAEWFIYIGEEEFMDDGEVPESMPDTAYGQEPVEAYLPEQEDSQATYPEDTIGAYLSGVSYEEDYGEDTIDGYPQTAGYREGSGEKYLPGGNRRADDREDTWEAPVQQEVDDRPVRRVIPVRDTAMRAPDGDGIYLDLQPDDTDSPDEEMDIDEFAQYACQYATSIDCSITGKSMLAMYERIEIMEEDGIKLTKANAEALIEEAADRAEKPSLGKAIKGLFSSKYNKDGLLILKEEHFI